jgi:hypothetical protein
MIRQTVRHPAFVFFDLQTEKILNKFKKQVNRLRLFSLNKLNTH